MAWASFKVGMERIRQRPFYSCPISKSPLEMKKALKKPVPVINEYKKDKREGGSKFEFNGKSL
jgi:hypothetical protein